MTYEVYKYRQCANDMKATNYRERADVEWRLQIIDSVPMTQNEHQSF